MGGLLGGTYWGYLYIEILWVSERKRGHGYGHALLDAAESEALSRGCKNAHLDSHDFQALSFYQGSGYQIVGQLDDLPPGHTRYLLRKVLTPSKQ